MNWSKLVLLLSLFWGLIGSVFLIKAILSLTPRNILLLTPGYSYADCSPEIIRSMSQQKAESLVGISFIVISFLLQIILIFIERNNDVITVSRWLGFWILLVVSSSTILATLFSERLSQHYRLAAGKLNIKDYCENNCGREITENNVSSIKGMAKELLDLDKKAGETDLEFLKRIGDYIGWQMPLNLNQEKGK